MNLKKHYNTLYTESVKRISAGEFRADTLIDSPEDNRLGITLLIRPPAEVKKNLSGFLQRVKKIEPCQYYYRESDMHITVLSLISCYRGFSLTDIKPPDYIDVIQKAVSGIKPFRIDFRGITASPSCVMIQGFPHNDTLDRLRNRLRVHFTQSALQHSIDSRYEIKTAHSTVIRLKENLENRTDYLKMIDSYRNSDFGSFVVNHLELVCNDWYQRTEKTDTLADFYL